MSGVCTDQLCAQLALHCPRLRHLAASGSRGLTDAALTALTGALRVDQSSRHQGCCLGVEDDEDEEGFFVPGCRQLRWAGYLAFFGIGYCLIVVASVLILVPVC